MKRYLKRSLEKLKYSYNYYLLSKAWTIRHNKVKETIINFQLSPSIKEHQKRWQILNNNFSPDTLNVCFSISGKDNIDYVPEEIFEGIIEKKLNNLAPDFMQHKSFYNRFFPKSIFIADLFHKIDNIFYSDEHKPIDKEALNEIIENVIYPVVVKKSIDTAGGRDVHFVKDKASLEHVLDMYDDIVVQPILKPHPYFRAFHDFGLNTIRACLYKSIKTGKTHLLNTTLRIGRDGHLDNETQGGLVCNLDDKGRLNEYVVDKYGDKLFKHPNSGIVFLDCEPIPAFDELKYLSISVAEMVPYAHIISLDLAMSEKGKWKLIEINLEYQTTRFAQYAGKPFFGEFTDEVIEYCRS